MVQRGHRYFAIDFNREGKGGAPFFARDATDADPPVARSEAEIQAKIVELLATDLPDASVSVTAAVKSCADWLRWALGGPEPKSEFCERHKLLYPDGQCCPKCKEQK